MKRSRRQQDPEHLVEDEIGDVDNDQGIDDMEIPPSGIVDQKHDEHEQEGGSKVSERFKDKDIAA
jgi:hypothetical protein